jgi:hypothetical protein
MAASCLNQRIEGFKPGDGYEYYKPAEYVSCPHVNYRVAQELTPINIIRQGFFCIVSSEWIRCEQLQYKAYGNPASIKDTGPRCGGRGKSEITSALRLCFN